LRKFGKSQYLLLHLQKKERQHQVLAPRSLSPMGLSAGMTIMHFLIATCNRSVYYLVHKKTCGFACDEKNLCACLNVRSGTRSLERKAGLIEHI
jgi:hypothetical protein